MQETSTFDSKSNASCMLLSPLTRVRKFHSWNFQCWLEVNNSMHETSTVTLKSKVSCMTLRRLTWIQKVHAWSFRSWLKSRFHAWNVGVGREVKISMLASSSVNAKCLALRRGSSDRYARGWNGSSGSFSKKLQTVGLNTKRGQTLFKPWPNKCLIMNRLGRARKVERNSFRKWTKKCLSTNRWFGH